MVDAVRVLGLSLALVACNEGGAHPPREPAAEHQSAVAQQQQDRCAPRIAGDTAWQDLNCYCEHNACVNTLQQAIVLLSKYCDGRS